jgi:DoxX-like family
MKKRNKIIYWIATIWLSLGMFSTGIVQLLRLKEQGNATAPGGAASLAHLGYPTYLLSLLGTLKILGVITVLIPTFPLLKEWAYAGFFFIMTGAIFSHIEIGDPFSESFPSVLLLILTVISWYFRPLNRKIILANQ